MQFLHVLTAKTLLKNPMQFTGIYGLTPSPVLRQVAATVVAASIRIWMYLVFILVFYCLFVVQPFVCLFL